MKLDANQEASMYTLWWDSSRSIKVYKDFIMEVESISVNDIPVIVRTKVRRRIDYFFLDRMVELLQIYDNVPNNVMEHVLKYKDERDMEFYQKFGMFEDHDDADIAHLLEESDEEIANYEDDLPEVEVPAQPSQ